MRYAMSEEMFGEKCKVFVHKDGSIDLSIGKHQKLSSGNTGQWIEYGQIYIEPHRPKGTWLLYTDDRKDYVECSECGYGNEGEVYLGEKTNFCPCCGADMRGETK